MNGRGRVLDTRDVGRWAIAMLTLGVMALLPYVATAQSYSVIPLGPGTHATDINNRPQVVGYVSDGHGGSWAFIWDIAGAHPLGIRIDPSGDLRINDAGIVVGLRLVDGGSRLFAWVNGGVHDLPSPPGDIPQRVSALTNTNVLLVQGLRSSWKYANGLWTDLTAQTGARIDALNEAGMLGGLAAGEPIVRYPDGHAIVPWASGGAVTLVGPAGHFASNGRGAGTAPFWWYGQSDGSVTQVGEVSVYANYIQTTDINSAGDVVGFTEFQTSPWRPSFTAAWLYRNGTTQWLPLSTAWAVNDAGYVVGSGATGGIVLVPSAPAPSGLLFTVVGRTVTLTWQPVADAVDYIVEAGSVSGSRDLYNASVGASPSLSTLAPPGRYYVRVRARTAGGTFSAPSQEVIIDVP